MKVGYLSLDLHGCFREKLSWLCWNSKEGFMRDYCNKGSETELDNEYSKDSWAFIAKGWREGNNGWKITKRTDISKVGGFSLKWLSRILAKSRSRSRPILEEGSEKNTKFQLKESLSIVLNVPLSKVKVVEKLNMNDKYSEKTLIL